MKDQKHRVGGYIQGYHWIDQSTSVTMARWTSFLGIIYGTFEKSPRSNCASLETPKNYSNFQQVVLGRLASADTHVRAMFLDMYAHRRIDPVCR